MVESDHEDAGLEGNLGTVTDEEWLQAHRALMEANPDLSPEHTAYHWAPGESPENFGPPTPEDTPNG